MSAEKFCRGCGNVLSGGALNGLCPVCLFREGLAEDRPGVETGPFMSGMGGTSSELVTLEKSIGGLPHVLLRDSDVAAGPGPLVQPASPEMPSVANHTGRLQLLGEIARGGMGAVLKGRDPDLGRDVAVKVLLESHRDKPELIRRFVEEAQIGGQLQHPGIVPIYELSAFADHRPFFAMKLVKGRTLSSLLDERSNDAVSPVGAGSVRRSDRRTEPPPTNKAEPAHDLPRFLSIFESVCQTIAYAHARGVIHRDLKPSNIMVGSFGEVQVMDWGLAKVLPQGGAADDASAGKTRQRETVIATARSGGETDSDLSRAGSVMGTPSYMAPEQARGEVERLDERCDVFALGSILCEILTGEPAFIGRSSGEIQRKASRGELEDALGRLERCASDVELVGLAKDCLASELEDRPRHAGEVAARINAYQTSVQERLRRAEIARAEEKARAEEATKRVRVERDRLRLTIALAAAVIGLVVLGGSGAFWLIQQKQQRLNDVERTLARVQAIRDQAAADGADPTRWREALAAADQALASVGHLAASEPGRRLAGLRAEIAEGQAQAERDRELIGELTGLRTSVEKVSWQNHPLTMDMRFTKAFERYGLSLRATPIEEGAARLKSRPKAFVREVVGGLDHWLFIGGLGNESRLGRDVPDLQTVLDFAKALDADPDRNQLRGFLKQADLKMHVGTLGVMARKTRLLELGSSTALLLARLLARAEDKENAIEVLRAAAARYPGDVWTNLELAKLLGSVPKPEWDEVIRYYTAARALQPETGWDLAEVLQLQGRGDEALVLNRELARRNPKSRLYLFSFWQSLQKAGNSEEAREVVKQLTAPFRERIGREPNDAFAHRELGELLWVTGDQFGAIGQLRDAVRIDPTSVSDQQRLGEMLRSRGDLPGAIAAYRAAIRANPSETQDHYTLASLLQISGDLRGQIGELREAIRAQTAMRIREQQTTKTEVSVPTQPGDEEQRAQDIGADEEMLDRFADETSEYAWFQGFLSGSFMSAEPLESDRGQIALANALAEAGDLSEAIATYLEAIRLGETDDKVGKGAPHACLGSARRLTGDLPGAVAAYREAIRLEPQGSMEARYALGMTLAEWEDVEAAIAAFREAIQLEHPNQHDQFRLLRVILMAQRPEEAIAAIRRVREQAQNDKTIVSAVDRVDRQFEHLSKLCATIPRVFRVSNQPNDFPEYYYRRRFFAASAAIWSAGFAADPKLAEDMNAQNRYNAACSAALAAAGAGIDKPPLDQTAKTRWRRQALTWLRADLTYWTRHIEGGVPKAKAELTKTLRHWESDRDLAGVRDEAELAKLPEPDRKDWQAFWAEVAALLKKAEAS